MILQLRNIRLLRPFVNKQTPVSLAKHCSDNHNTLKNIVNHGKYEKILYKIN